MYRALAALALALAALAADPPWPPDAPAAPPPAKGHLPPHFKGLGLTPDQTKSIGAITGAAAVKVHDLEAQIAAIRDQEHKDALAVLTEAQRKQLAELVTGEKPDTATPPPSPPPAKDKPPL